MCDCHIGYVRLETPLYDVCAGGAPERVPAGSGACAPTGPVTSGPSRRTLPLLEL